MYQQFITIMLNPYYISLSIYVLGSLLQLLITIHFMRKRVDILIDEYGYQKHELRLLFLTSVVFWPYSFYQGIRSYIDSSKFKSRTSDIEIEEDEGY